ncbi:MAG: PHP domain-containing protein [Candidatus Hydrothermarchaeales archaeon]
MRLDLHIHTKYSRDSRLSPEEIIRVAKKRGLEGIAIADHDTITGGIETLKVNEDPDFAVIAGSEVHTDRGEIIGYFLNEEINSRELYEVVDEMRAQDAIISIPHPLDIFRFSRLNPNEEILKRVDCIEVFNSRCVLSRFNEDAKKLAEEGNFAMTAGSDAHALSEIGAAGVILSKDEDIREAILKNEKTFGRCSPAYVHVFSTLTKIWR